MLLVAIATLALARAAAPSDATARCVDRTYSFSATHSGTCSHHGGVAQWLDAPAAPPRRAGARAGTAFCRTHRCIANFPNGKGFVVRCRDGMWSHSGGRSGACSGHAGETRVRAR